MHAKVQNAIDPIDDMALDNNGAAIDPESLAAHSSLYADGLNSELAGRWLKWQCRMIADVISASVYTPNGELLTQWPADADGLDVLTATAGLSRQSGSSVIKTENNFGTSGSRIGDVLACPIMSANNTIAYVGVLMTPRPQSRQNAVLQLMQWSGYWLESLSQLSQGISQEAAEFTRSLLTRMSAHSSSQQLAMELVNSLAVRLACERVSMGFREGLVVHLQCISGLATFDSRTRLARSIESAMEESLDSGGPICQPTDGHHTGTDNAHRELISDHNSTAVCTLPMALTAMASIESSEAKNPQYFAAITLERQGGEGFDHDAIKWCQSILEVVAPVIALKKYEERPLWQKIADSTKTTLVDFMGPNYTRTRAITSCVLAAILLTTIFNGSYEVSANARVTGEVSQIVAAPQAGFIKTAEVRAGDQVSEGQLLARLDDRSLQLELNKWQSEKNQTQKAYQEAMAKKARTELSILRAKADQIDAELALVEQQIERMRLRAPIDGYVISGDLNQSLGSPVEVGDVLFEVAPLQQYRVVLEVDQRDMADVETGQGGRIRIAAMPGDAIEFDVDQIVPLAISNTGGSFFRVEAQLREERRELRPGMEGVARLEIGERTLFWIWTHKLFNRARLWLWSIGW